MLLLGMELSDKRGAFSGVESASDEFKGHIV